MDKALIFFAKSRYADLFGVALVVAIAIGSGYLSTNLAKYVDWGPLDKHYSARPHLRHQRGYLHDVHPPHRPPLKRR